MGVSACSGLLTGLIVVAIVLVIIIVLALRSLEPRLWSRVRPSRTPLRGRSQPRLTPVMTWASESGLPSAAYNPSSATLSDGRVLRTYRLSTFTRCPGSQSERYYRDDPGALGSRVLLAWTSSEGEPREALLDIAEPPRTRGSSLRFVSGYEDPRVVEWRSHVLLLVNARREDALGRPRMHLVHVCSTSALDALPARGHSCRVARLSCPWESPSSDEKNWVPIVHGERLYLLYSLLPHRLLAVPPLELDVADDRASPLSPHGIVTCEVVADSSVEDTVSRCRAWGVPTSVLLPDGERRSLACPEFRGGTQAVRCIGAHGPCLVGVGHFRSSADYYSAAFELAPEPPFLLRRLGSAWKLEGAKIEYVSGLRVGPEGNLVASYGVDDCASCEVALSYDELFAPR